MSTPADDIPRYSLDLYDDDDDDDNDVYGQGPTRPPMFDRTTAVSTRSSLGAEDAETTSGASDHTGSSQNGQSQPPSPALAVQETRQLRCSKGIVFLVLLIAAASSTYVVYRVSSQDDEEAYKTRFYDFANEIVAVSKLNAESVIQTYETMSLHVTASVKADTWPMTSVPSFEGLSQDIMEFTETVYVGLIPLVHYDQLSEYELYHKNNLNWIDEGLDFVGRGAEKETILNSITPYIFNMDDGSTTTPIRAAEVEEFEYFLPVSHIAPIALRASLLNYNILDEPYLLQEHRRVLETKSTVLSNILNWKATPDFDRKRWPSSTLATPVWRKMVNQVNVTAAASAEQELVAMITGQMPWHGYFHDLIPEGTEGMYLVVRNTCDQAVTYLIEGPDVTYVGPGDQHNSIDDVQFVAPFDSFESLESCQYTLHVHPTREFHARYHSNQPIINAVSVALTFLVTACVFIFYDILVESRQNKIVKIATRSITIVSSLFPANVRDRLMNDESSNATSNGTGRPPRQSSQAKRFHKNNDASLPLFPQATAAKVARPPRLSTGAKSKPIADIFLHVTVMFADIVGFTAWASMREPCQVFELLESIYNAFDQTAKRLGVFKVETVGDCYVAACGLPDANEKHAEIMVRFARACLLKMYKVSRELSSVLGPDTRDLSIRTGLNSGPVTAGVLRGEKSRFQLFGDTVNLAARMEQTSLPGKIQCSQSTADELMSRGKAKWIKAREHAVVCKGKGTQDTYWIETSPSKGDPIPRRLSSTSKIEESLEDDSNSKHTGSVTSSSSSKSVTAANSDPYQKTATELEIQWNVDVLQSMLKRIIAMRGGSVNIVKLGEVAKLEGPSTMDTSFKELNEEIQFPTDAHEYKINPESIKLSEVVVTQIDDFVRNIAGMYRENAFHNFSHASHVVQSTVKLLMRVVTRKTIDYGKLTYTEHSGDKRLHEFTYGITSDPITQFACVLVALVHDVDHQGVPNQQLVKEKSRLAHTYDCRSMAEKNSLDLSWDLLMDDHYKELRACIFNTEQEFIRFRQLMVNMVLATDVMDKELGALRKTRWEKAFNLRRSIRSQNDPQALKSTSSGDDIHSDNDNDRTATHPPDQQDINRMATIVIEHLIQASDVAHTMQHWHVYAKWNERLFHEMYHAYEIGRSENDPSVAWYEGEIQFFDHYVIPLAKKLQECGVFGVSSDEYLNYAQANRREWAARGKDMVEQYKRSYSGPTYK